MMTSSNGNIVRVTGHLCGEFTGHRWIPRTKASDAELLCFSDLCLNKRLSKQSWGWWFETLSRPLWHQCNGNREHRGGYHCEHIYNSRFPKLCHFTSTPPTGDYLSIEIPSCQYRNSHYKDKTASRPRPSYLYNGNSYTSWYLENGLYHYNDVIMSTMASQITILTIVYSTVYSGADQRKHQSSASWPLCGEFTGHWWIPRTKGQ